MEVKSKLGVGISSNMEEAGSHRYKDGSAEQLRHENSDSEQARLLLQMLITSSSELSIRVWLDGIYTDIEDADPQGHWMYGREVYFKVEGRALGLGELAAVPTGGS